MRRILRIPLVLVLFALVLAPAAVLPFAERLRTEWAKFWDPEPEEPEWIVSGDELHVYVNGIYLCPTDWSNATSLDSGLVVESEPILVVEPLAPIGSGEVDRWYDATPNARSNGSEKDFAR